MSDKIKGIVTAILDDTSIQLYTTQVHKGNKSDYALNEIVKIAGIAERNMNMRNVDFSSSDRNLLGQDIVCFVERRDEENRIIACVSVPVKKSTV